MKFQFFRFRPQQDLAPNAEGGGEGGSGAPAATPPAAENQTGEDLTGLKNALAAERKRASQLDTEYKQYKAAFEGIDPEVAKQAATKLAQLQANQEEWNQKETALKTSLQEEFNRQITKEKETAKTWQEKHDGLLTRTLAQQAYEAAGGQSGGSDDGTTFFDAFFNNVKGGLRLNEKGQVEVVDGTGARRFSAKNSAEPRSAAEFFAGYSSHPVYSHFFAPQKNSKGGGMQPGAGTQKHNGTVRVIDRHDTSSLSDPGVIEALAKGDGSVIIR